MSRSAPTDVIAAQATPPGAGALAIVRASGPGVLDVAGRVFQGRAPLTSVEGFRAAVGRIVEASDAVDEVVAWVYRAPHSYTGEDMVEISCHGGTLAAARILEVLWRAGARPAEPGEFTRRAFLSGRIDLAQAEGVADFIAARGRRAQEQALAQLDGGLSRRIRGLAARIRDVLVRIEGHLDFGDDVPEIPGVDVIDADLASVEGDLRRLLATHAPSRRARDGLVLALVGRPNVGKSSLLNALAGFDRALVHAEPGTTRDVVDTVVEWDGVPIRLVDTAGIREQAEPVEKAGIERSRREMARADAILWVLDASEEVTEDDRSIGKTVDPVRTYAIFNKIDRVESDVSGGPRLNGGGEWVNSHSLRGTHKTSALTGRGVDLLVAGLTRDLLAEAPGGIDGVSVSSERHAHQIAEALAALTRGRGILGRGEALELGAADLHRASGALAEITGDRAGDDLLDAIFGRFCIGK